MRGLDGNGHIRVLYDLHELVGELLKIHKLTTSVNRLYEY